jgi:hypothetical protein
MRILPHGRFFANPPAARELILGSTLFSVEQVNNFGYRKVNHQGDQDMGGQSPELSANRNLLTGDASARVKWDKEHFFKHRH